MRKDNTENHLIKEIEINYKGKGRRIDTNKIETPMEASVILNKIWSNKIEYVEEFIILCLNKANNVLGWVKISQGGISGTVADTKLIFQAALKANASSIILSHNHPSCNIEPSNSDIKQTWKIEQAGNTLDIKVLDHIIISKYDYYSFVENKKMTFGASQYDK